MSCDAQTLINLARSTDGYGKLSQRDILLCLAAVYAVNGNSWNAQKALDMARDYARLSFRDLLMCLLAVLCSGGGGGTDPAVLDWEHRVIVNGGPDPTPPTLTCIDTFYKAIKAGGLLSKIISLVVFVPDSLIAATTPIVVNAGLDPWGNHNFVAGDLTVNGLKGNAATKYLDTGLSPSAVYPASADDGGLTIYDAVDTATQSIEIGAWGAGIFNDPYGLYADWSGTTYFDCYGSGARINTAAPGAGYISANRTTANPSMVMYYAKSTTPHGVLVSGNIASTEAVTTPNLACFGNNAGNSGINAFSDKRLSFACIHHGFTQAESLTMFNAIQACRVCLGGGFV